MLDLNLGFLSTHQEDKDCKGPASMFSTEEEASSSTSTSMEGVISFGILNREEDVEIIPRRPPPESDLSQGGKWLNLSSMQQEVEVKKIKSRRGPKSRSSHYRGVTFYRRTGRWESHIWDCGKQVYLGGFDTAYTAARAYDRAAIKFRGLHADINFIVDDYKQDIEKVKNLSKEELVQTLKRESSSLVKRSFKYKDFTPTKCTNVKNDHFNLFQNRGWNEVATQCNEMRKMGDIKLGAYNKGNEDYDLELSLGISSTSKNTKSKTPDSYSDINRSMMSLYGKTLPAYLPM